MHDSDMADAPEQGKRQRKKRTRFDWYKRYPQAFQDGTRKLSIGARGAYNDILDLLALSDDGCIPDNNRWIACALHVTIHHWRERLRKELFAHNKLFTRNGAIYNAKASEVLAERQVGCNLSANGVHQYGLFDNEINGGVPTDKRREKRSKKEKTNRLLVPEGPPVEVVPTETSATIVRLDDHRRPTADPFGVREDQFARYHQLVTGWGMKADAMVLSPPLERSVCDLNLSRALDRHVGREPDVVLTAVDATLTAMEAVRHDELRSGRLRGRAGLGPCASYFSKALNGHVSRLLIEAAALEAAARAEMAVQKALLEKRLDGVASGRSNGHGRGTSWDDIAAEAAAETGRT